MNFDSLSIAAMTAELQQTVLDGRVQKVTQVNSLNFGLEIFVHPTRYYLIISVEPQLPHLYVTTQKSRRGSGNETPLMLVLRKYMRGAILRKIEQPPHERLLFLHFENYVGRTILVIELLGPRSNLMLLDSDHTILGVARLSKTGRRTASPRQRIYLPGQPYQPLPVQNKLAPDALTLWQLEREFAESSPNFSVAKLLPQIVRGVSPQMAREIVYQATGKAKATVGEVTDMAALLRAWGRLFAHLAENRWQPTLALDEEDVPRAVAPYPLTHLSARQRQVDSFSEAVQIYLAESAAAYAAAKAPLLEAISEARRKLTRRQARLQEDAAKQANPAAFKTKGEAILAHAHDIEWGQTTLVLEDDIEIKLDPDRSASDNAQQYFKQYRKALRSSGHIPAQVEKIKLDAQYLDQLEQDVQNAENRVEIDTVASMLAETSYYRSVPQHKKKKRKKSARNYLQLTAPDGATVWVGKNAHQNAHLTFERAASEDLWLHARDVPGSHVIVPTAQGLPSEEDVVWAAGVAAYYSKARHDTSVEVIVTLKKYIRAIKGAAPGLVTYRRESTLRVTPQLPDLE